MELPYSQQAGFGGGATVSYDTESGVFEELCEHFNDIGALIDISVPSFSDLNIDSDQDPNFTFEYQNKTDTSRKFTTTKPR
jgi:hypothetical protein